LAERALSPSPSPSTHYGTLAERARLRRALGREGTMNELSDGEEVVGRSEGQEAGAKTECAKREGLHPK
jgi:hypothetical protein